jgi:NRPS condensation-like uncharacterized protein
MVYKAEIFDIFQYIYEATGYNDHQIHCVISFDGRIDSEVLAKSFRLLLKVIPILSCAYRLKDGVSCWESIDPDKQPDLFKTAEEEEEFEKFTASRTDECTGPQIRACLYTAEKSRLSIIINHMITDAASFKQCLYLLSDIYTKLTDNPGYLPDYVIDGDRSFRRVTSALTLGDKIKAFLKTGESNRRSTDRLSLSGETEVVPFIVTKQIPKDRYSVIYEYGKSHGVTINDIVLAAFYRVLARTLGAEGRTLSMPVMVDMRRYLADKSFQSLTNLSSAVTTSLRMDEGEIFDETVAKVNREMNGKKAGNIGMNAFMKLALVFKIFREKASFGLLGKGLKNPLIGMTNIGIIDSQKLVFSDTAVKDAYLCASIKYRPHFQMAFSSFNNTITLSSGLYGSAADRKTVSGILEEVADELPGGRGEGLLQST